MQHTITIMSTLYAIYDWIKSMLSPPQTTVIPDDISWRYVTITGALLLLLCTLAFTLVTILLLTSCTAIHIHTAAQVDGKRAILGTSIECTQTPDDIMDKL